MTIDKSKWPRGEWDGEPDRMNFKTNEGFDAAIIRTRHSGCLCGYVGVSKDHPWHGMNYSAEISASKEQMERPVDVNKISILSVFSSALNGANEEAARIDCLVSVHGGLTYSDKGIADFGEDPELWYFGFDTSHSGDYSPGMAAYFSDGTYRDLEYVKQEIQSLSEQLNSVLVVT